MSWNATVIEFKTDESPSDPLSNLAAIEVGVNKFAFFCFRNPTQTCFYGRSRVVNVVAVETIAHFEAQSIPRAEMNVETSPANEQIKLIAASVGAQLVDPMRVLCTDLVCSPVDDLGRPLYKDMTHIRSSVARDRIMLLDPFVLAAPR